MFKQRVKDSFFWEIIKVKRHYKFFALTLFRFEYHYWRFLLKHLKIRYKRKGILNLKPKYSIYCKPNNIISKKSKNQRMGAGVGKFYRLTKIFPKNKIFIKFKFYSYFRLTTILRYWKHYFKHKFLIK